ncbi:MAG: transcriptional repressor [Tannerellaceae bacterium]|nr:transcriptional repressor [Tannerellaceae bacterium]
MDITELLKEKKLKKTNARIAIVSILSQSAFPLSEKEIKESMGGDYDRITFYRTAQTLVEAGIIHRIIIDNTQIKYAYTRDNKSDPDKLGHIHFYCTECCMLSCMEDVPVQKYILPKGYIQEECEVFIKGVCKSCNEKRYK